jgi:hypothetical protein
VPTLEIVSLALLGALGWFWLDSLKARDAAILAARKACESEGLQFLDETVAIGGLKPARNDDGQLLLRRVYNFEYSDTGDNRRQGSVVLLGQRVMVLNIGPLPLSETPTLH